MSEPHPQVPASAPRPRRRWTRRRFLALGAGALAGSGVLWMRLAHYRPGFAVESLAHLSPRAAGILAAVLATALPPGADRSPERLRDHLRFLDGYLAGLPRDAVFELHVLLFGLEHGPLVFGPHLARFSGLDARQREDYLRGWQRSRIGLRRLGLRSLTTLAFLAHYRSMDSFLAIGYTGPAAPGFAGPPASQERYDRLLAPPGQSPQWASDLALAPTAR